MYAHAHEYLFPDPEIRFAVSDIRSHSLRARVEYVSRPLNCTDVERIISASRVS